MDIESVKQEVKQTVMGLRKKEILAVGLFGSLARGDFGVRSDIDVFVITENKLTLEEQDELYYVFSELIPKFGRDVTVLAYDIDSLKEVPSWQTLNLIKDAYFVYDRGRVREIFKMILKKAQKHGIVYDEKEKVFRLKKVGRLTFSLK